MTADDEKSKRVLWLALSATPNNVGDVYMQALDVAAKISSSTSRQEAEYYISQIRSLARDAEIGWRLFASPPQPSHSPSDEEVIQTHTLIATLHSFCYGAERLDEASFFTGPASTPVRFYINSIYHYIAALYLLDKGNLPMGGTVFKVLQPMGLSSLLDPIRNVLDQPMEGDLSFGKTVKAIRNKFLVHGTFSPDDISTVVKKTQLHDMTQLLHLTQLIWDLFNHSFILKLKLIAILTSLGLDLEEFGKRVLAKYSP